MATDRDPERTVKIVSVQCGRRHCRDGNPGPEANFAALAELTRQAASEAKPDLIVWPEYAITGWPYPPEAAMNGTAEAIPGDGPWYRRYVELASETGCALVGYMVEAREGKRYGAAFLLASDGTFVGKYNKVHANLGEQTWWGWSQGEAFEVVEHEGVRYGFSICSDMWFPETVRCSELLGADVILHQSIADDMGHLVPARAFDSSVPIVMTIFQGGSYAVDARGALLGKLDAESPGWRSFDLKPFAVRTARKYGGLWIPKLGHQNLRNLDAYGPLVDPARRPPWTRVFLDAEGGTRTREQLLKRFGGRYDAKDPEGRATS